MNHAIRRLGSIETRMALFHSELGGSTQGTQVIRFSANISSVEFKAAVNRLHSVYEPLQCSIKEEGDELWFCRDVVFQDVPVLYCEMSSEKDLQQTVSSAVDNPLDAERSLWRMILVSMEGTDSHVLIFTAHHAIIDASGMHDIANTFFKLVSAQVVENALPETSLFALPLPVDDLLQSGVEGIPGGQYETCLHDAACPVTHRKTGWQVIELVDYQMEALHKALKEDNLKFHSIVSAALSQAMYDVNLVKSEFNFGTAVTLRFLQNVNPAYHNPLGCYMSIASNSVDPRERNLAVLARKYDRDLMRTIMTTSLKKENTQFSDFKRVTKVIAKADSFQGAGITNMAEVGIAAHYPGVAVTDYAMLANRVSANFSIVAHCYEFAGKQSIVLVYPTPSLSCSTVCAVAKSLQEKLLQYSGGAQAFTEDEAFKAVHSTTA